MTAARRAACWRSKIEKARNLRDRFPQELLAHRALLITVYWAPWGMPGTDVMKRDLRREYEALARRYPANAAYPYILARLEDNRTRKVAFIGKALQLDPGFAWAHEAWITHRRKITDAEKPEARVHAATFARLCPNRPAELLKALGQLQDRDAWAAAAPALRKAVTVENGRTAELPSLWEMEFRFAAPSDFDALRARVRDDLEALRRLDRTSDRAWLTALQNGYEITTDEKGTQAVQALWLEKFPCGDEAARIRMQAREAEVASRAPGAPDPWVGACPNDPVLWQFKLVEATSAGDAETAGRRALALVGDDVSERVASIYLDKGVRPDRVAPLIDQAERRSDRMRRRGEASLEGDDLRSWRTQLAAEELGNQALRVRLALARKQPGEADLALAALAEDTNRVHQLSRPQDGFQSYGEARLWSLRAERKLLDGRDEEALADYRRSLEKNSENKDVVKAARTLYAKLRGGETGFDQWHEAAARQGKSLSQEVTRATRRPLPELALTDLKGRAWSSSELKGKAVLVNFWATWCGPCVRELPSLQALYEKVKAQKNVVIVTVNVDDNPGLVEPFLSKSKYTFPVFLGGPGSFERLALAGIPQTYVVDPSGTIVEEQFGFSGDGEAWMKKDRGVAADGGRGRGQLTYAPTSRRSRGEARRRGGRSPRSARRRFGRSGRRGTGWGRCARSRSR